jgi:hypothetical protein
MRFPRWITGWFSRAGIESNVSCKIKSISDADRIAEGQITDTRRQ